MRKHVLLIFSQQVAPLHFTQLTKLSGQMYLEQNAPAMCQKSWKSAAAC